MQQDSASISGEAPQPQQAQQPEVRIIVRLSPDVYLKFEKSLPQAVIDKNAPDAGCDASFKLGVQYVLHRLRNELVVE